MAKGGKDEELILLDHWVSLFSMRVRVALAEKGITNYECKEENITILGGKSPMLLEMNPVHKQIPVLIHNGKPVSESLIIVEYIDEVFTGKSGGKLLPSDPYQRSQGRFWAHFVDTKVYPPSLNIWRTKGETQERAKADFIESLKVLEDELGEKCFFGGENFGFVDIALIPFYCWFYTYEVCGNFSIEAVCPKIVAWGKRCAQREAMLKSLPDISKVSELILELRSIQLAKQEW